MFCLNEQYWYQHYTDVNTGIYRHISTHRPLIVSYEMDGSYSIYFQSFDQEVIHLIPKKDKERTVRTIWIISDFYRNQLGPIALEEMTSMENKFLLNSNVLICGEESLTVNKTNCINTVQL